MKIFFLLILTIVRSNAKHISCQRLGNRCNLAAYKYHDLKFTKQRFVCDSLEANFTFNKDELKQLQVCKYEWLHIYYKLNRPAILDRSMDLNGLKSFSHRSQQLNPTILFKNIKGFDIDSFPSSIKDYFLIDWEFYATNFEFYTNGSVINSCNQLKTSIRSLFQTLTQPNSIVYFFNAQFRFPICPFLFANISVHYFEFFGFIDTFYKRNFLKFTNESAEKLLTGDINSSITSVKLAKMENIKLDSSILNELAFKNIKILQLNGEIRSIQTGVFRSFRNLKTIEIDVHFLKILMHRGIDWIRDINKQIDIDLRNKSQQVEIKELRQIYFRLKINTSLSEDYLTFYRKISIPDSFPDEDFCLYEKFPFNQLVLFIIVLDQQKLMIDHHPTCTFVWLTQYYDVYFEFMTEDDRKNNDWRNMTRLVDQCEFKKR